MFGFTGGFEMASEARCEVCGRPWDGGTLLPREVRCGGCHDELLAFQALVDAKGARVHTDEAARAMAYNLHANRELAAFDSLIKTRRERVASGKSAEDGVTDLQDFTDAKGKKVTVAEMKARAQAALDKEDG